MRSRILVLAGLMFAVLPFARADEWSKSYTVTGKPDLRVETADASIRVDTWDQNTIDVRVTTERYKIGENIKIIEHQNGDSPIRVASFRAVVALARVVLPETDDLESQRVDACLGELVHHARRPGR